MYDWGYREDSFFTRVDEYLQKHYTSEKLFIFITASATNHTPFKVHDGRLLDKIPYPNPKKFAERFSTRPLPRTRTLATCMTCTRNTMPSAAH